MTNNLYSTYFVNSNGDSLGDMPGLLQIPLRQDMQITIHGHSETFKVTDWRFHQGHPDEKAGLTIVLDVHQAQ